MPSLAKESNKQATAVSSSSSLPNGGSTTNTSSSISNSKPIPVNNLSTATSRSNVSLSSRYSWIHPHDSTTSTKPTVRIIPSGNSTTSNAVSCSHSDVNVAVAPTRSVSSSGFVSSQSPTVSSRSSALQSTSSSAGAGTRLSSVAYVKSSSSTTSTVPSSVSHSVVSTRVETPSTVTAIVSAPAPAPLCASLAATAAASGEASACAPSATSSQATNCAGGGDGKAARLVGGRRKYIKKSRFERSTSKCKSPGQPPPKNKLSSEEERLRRLERLQRQLANSEGYVGDQRIVSIREERKLEVSKGPVYYYLYTLLIYTLYIPTFLMSIPPKVEFTVINVKYSKLY